MARVKVKTRTLSPADCGARAIWSWPRLVIAVRRFGRTHANWRWRVWVYRTSALFRRDGNSAWSPLDKQV